jgi:23S rRNA G2445 N2-methylase RlmL
LKTNPASRTASSVSLKVASIHLYRAVAAVHAVFETVCNAVEYSDVKEHLSSKKKTPALFRNDRTALFNSDSISDVSKKNAALYTDQTIVGKHQSIDIVSATADPRVC